MSGYGYKMALLQKVADDGTVSVVANFGEDDEQVLDLDAGHYDVQIL